MNTISTDMQIALGRTIRELRKRRGFSQESFADEVGIHRTYMGAVERGERNISLKNLLRISDSLGLPLSSLIAEAEACLGPTTAADP
jgi:transcriptional regulator with XRE-family HTH domain